MSILDIVLLVGTTTAAVSWLMLAAYVVVIQRRRAAARAALSGATDFLRQKDVARLPIGDRVVRVRERLAGASREMVMHGSADAETREIGDTLAAYLVERWGINALDRDAMSHRTSRAKWRRMAALRILCRLGYAKRLELLA